MDRIFVKPPIAESLGPKGHDAFETVPAPSRAQGIKSGDGSFQALLEVSPDAVVIANQHGEIVLMNAQTEKLFGYRREELLYRPIELLVPARLRSQHPFRWNEIDPHPQVPTMDGGLELFCLRKDDSEFPAEISLSALETEEGVLIFNTIRDLTARRRTEEDLRRLASIVAWSDDAIIGKTLGGIITSWNAGAERIYGYLAKEAIGKHVSMLVPFDRPDEIPQILKLLERGETVNHFETIRVRKDGEKIQIAVTTSPIRDGTGRIVGASTVSRDISVRKQAEEHAVEMDDELKRSAETNRIRQLELQLKDDFLSHVSHELRSPLTAIYQFGTIIADGLAGETSHEQNEFLRIILRNVRQLQSMIDDLLEVTRAQEGKLSIELERVSVSEAIVYAGNTFQGAAEAKGITLSFDPSANLPSAYADPTRLRQILIILLDNAIKFTPIGGAVKVYAEVFEKDPAFLLIEVSDTGCGIGPKMTERIFEHLYQITDPGQAGRKGLGLGLHISKELVTRQGGKIWVDSDPQKGSRFFFTTPIFFLASWVGPILTYEMKPGDGIALLAVEMSSRDGSLSPDVRKEMAYLVRRLLQQCLRPETDALLPKMDLASVREIFFLVACTQKHGPDVIGKRIRTQFQRSEQLRPSDLTFSISHTFLTPISREMNESMETFSERVVAGIQDSINTISLKRSV